MSKELDNLVAKDLKLWEKLDESLSEDPKPIFEECQKPLIRGLNLIRAQLTRAKKYGDNKPDSLYNGELLGFAKKRDIFDPNINPDDLVEGVRIWYARLDSHLSLILPNRPDNYLLMWKQTITKKMLGYLPPEPKIYPSDKPQQSTDKQPVFFQPKES